jgi:uncharacterized membrane protein
MAEEVKTTKDPDVESGKSMAWLAYLGILFLVPLLAMKDNKFAQYHAKQGMWLFVVEVALWILSFIFGFFPSILALILGIIIWLLWIVILVFAIMGIVKALQGEYWKMPIIGNWVKEIKI